jgi:hypothetical protein
MSETTEQPTGDVAAQLEEVAGKAHELYEAGPGTVGRKLAEVDVVLDAAVDAIKQLDERTH